MIYLVFWVPASFLVLFPKKTLVWKSGTNTAADSFLDGALHFLLRKLRLQLSTESGYDFLHIGAQSYSGPLCLSWFDAVEMWLFVRLPRPFEGSVVGLPSGASQEWWFRSLQGSLAWLMLVDAGWLF